MDKKQISEEKILEVISQVLNEEVSKIKREDYTRLLYRIDDFEKSLSELMKEFHKIDGSTPTGLKYLCKDKMTKINNNLIFSQRLLSQLKDKIWQKRRQQSSQQNISQIEEKKKKN